METSSIWSGSFPPGESKYKVLMGFNDLKDVPYLNNKTKLYVGGSEEYTLSMDGVVEEIPVGKLEPSLKLTYNPPGSLHSNTRTEITCTVSNPNSEGVIHVGYLSIDLPDPTAQQIIGSIPIASSMNKGSAYWGSGFLLLAGEEKSFTISVENGDLSTITDPVSVQSSILYDDYKSKSTSIEIAVTRPKIDFQVELSPDSEIEQGTEKVYNAKVTNLSEVAVDPSLLEFTTGDVGDVCTTLAITPEGAVNASGATVDPAIFAVGEFREYKITLQYNDLITLENVTHKAVLKYKNPVTQEEETREAIVEVAVRPVIDMSVEIEDSGDGDITLRVSNLSNKAIEAAGLHFSANKGQEIAKIGPVNPELIDPAMTIENNSVSIDCGQFAVGDSKSYTVHISYAEFMPEQKITYTATLVYTNPVTQAEETKEKSLEVTIEERFVLPVVELDFSPKGLMMIDMQIKFRATVSNWHELANSRIEKVLFSLSNDSFIIDSIESIESGGSIAWDRASATWNTPDTIQPGGKNEYIITTRVVKTFITNNLEAVVEVTCNNGKKIEARKTLQTTPLTAYIRDNEGNPTTKETPSNGLSSSGSKIASMMSSASGDQHSMSCESCDLCNWMVVCDGVCGPEDANAGDPITLNNLEFTSAAADLTIQGRMNYDFVRYYSSRINFHGALGHNWTSPVLDCKVIRHPDDENQVILYNGKGRGDAYFLANGKIASPEYHFRKMILDEEQNLLLRNSNGTIYKFKALDGSANEGRMLEKMSSCGNRITMEYNERGQMIRVWDSMSRPIEHEYDNRGHLVKITDFIGRETIFSYDENDDLVSVQGAKVEGTSTGNDFPTGKITRYTYSQGLEEEFLNHNLISITAPNEVATEMRT